MGGGVWHLSLASIFLHLTSLLILEEFQLRMQNCMSISLKMFTMRCKPTVISCYKKFQSVIKLLLFSPESFSVGVGGMKFEQLLERFRDSSRGESGPSTRIGPAPGLMWTPCKVNFRCNNFGNLYFLISFHQCVWILIISWYVDRGSIEVLIRLGGQLLISWQTNNILQWR